MGTVLVVDDRPINRKFLAALLGYAGHDVVEAADGKEALAKVYRSRPDLIITDVMMPGMDGVELVRQLHADTRIADIPVVFYTATYRLHEARELARSCGVVLVLPKPSGSQVILDAVARILGSQATNDPFTDSSPDVTGATGPRRLSDLVVLQQRLHEALDSSPDDREDTGQPRRIDSRGRPLVAVHALSLRLAALLEIDLSLGTERDPQRLLNMFCRAAQDILGSHHAGIVVVEADLRTPSLWTGSGLDAEAQADIGTIDLEQGFLGAALRSQEPIDLKTLDGDPSRGGLPSSHPPIHTILAVPVRSTSGVRGVLYFADKIGGTPFNEDDAQFAATLAAQFALFYSNLKLLEGLQNHAGELQLEVDERKHAVDVLRESEMRFRQLAENIRTVFFLVDAVSNRTLYISPSYESIWGKSCASLYADPQSWADAVHPDDRARVLASAEPLVRNEGFEHEYRIVRPDGGIRWIWVRGIPIRNDDGAVYRIAATAEDVTERREQRERIARLSRIRAVIGGISSAMLRLRDRDELFREACRVAATAGVFPLAWVTAPDPQTGRYEIIVSHGEVQGSMQDLGHALRDLVPETDQPSYRAARAGHSLVVNDFAIEPTLAPISAELQRRGYHAGAAMPLFVEGRVVAVLVLLAAERDFFDAEEMALLEWLASDLSFALEHIQNSQRLDHLAYYDALTGLPNASLFRDRLEQIVHAAKLEQGKVCVVVVDLEHFTRINDTLGRVAGDELLRKVGERFGEVLVEPYTLGRIGADTFAVASPRDVEFIATQLRDSMFEALSQPFNIDGREVHVTAQAGIALFPADGDDGNSVFKNAEAALKLAKSGGERYVYHSSEMNAQIAQRLVLEQQLRAAIATQQFVLHYQPRIDMISGALIGAEALIRWQHPERGLLAPAEFLGLAEQTGLVVPMGSWAIQSVCAQQAAWIAAGVFTVPIAVNLSSVQFATGDLLRTVRAALAAHSLDPKFLDLELTESAVMNDSAAAVETLQALRVLGVGLALDDFGTGYSSLAHLKRFPFDSVKIDRSFVTDITSNAEDAAIATAIIAMAHSLKLKVVAEGVETQGQFNYLRAQGCDEMQGFLFGPAVVNHEFESQLRSSKRMTMPTQAPADLQTLLLVDDEHGIRAALTRVMRRDGYRILTAANGQEGLELLAVNAVQVIISDQRMPGMSGTAFLSTVKQLYPDTMRIILSGYTDLEVVTDAVNRGSVFKFLIKPWDDELLREQVRDAFRRYRPEKSTALPL